MNWDEQPSSASPTQRVLKIIVVGDIGTGKTSFVRQFVEGDFSEFYKSTIGVDFANKIVQWNVTTFVDVQLWDIAGQERYGNMTSVYYRQAVGALVVFDVTLPSTRTMVQMWKKDIDDKVRTSRGQPVPALLLGNKIDLIPSRDAWEQGRKELDDFVRANNFLRFFETSAKDRTNVNEAMMCLVDYIMRNKIESQAEAVPPSLDPAKRNQPQKRGGCCDWAGRI
jgi:small GTP-binding protein